MKKGILGLFVALAVGLVIWWVAPRQLEVRSQPALAPAAVPAARAPEVRPQIAIGQVMPYTGINVAYDVVGKVQVAYFAMINRAGGIRGRDVNLISMDDGSDPATAREQVGLLVEQQQTIAILTPVGTEVNSAIRDYLNTSRIPQLFAASGASTFHDPGKYPWTIGFRPSYELEGRTYAQHILKTNPDARVAILFRNDSAAKEVLAALKSGLGSKGKIVAQVPYEPRAALEPTQLRDLQRARADILVGIGDSEIAAQALRQLEQGVTLYLAADDASGKSALQSAGAVPGRSVLTATYYKDPSDLRWKDDPGVRDYLAFLEAEFPHGSPSDPRIAYGYLTAQALARILTACEDDLSPANVMKKATGLADYAPGLLLPGVTITTADFQPVDQLQLLKVEGRTFALAD